MATVCCGKVSSAIPATLSIYVWICEDFTITNPLHVESPSFRDNLGRRWKLCLQSVQSQHLFTLCCLSARSAITVDVIPSIHFLDKHGKIFQPEYWKTGNIETFFPGMNYLLLIIPFALQEKLELLLYNGNLRIQLRLTEVTARGWRIKPFNNQKAPSALTSDLSMLYENGTLSDITILSGQETFCAHKAILAGRSPVFRAMLEAPMKETATNSITIHDFLPEVVRGMLKYLYSDDVTVVTPTLAIHFLQIADMYSLDNLKWEAESILSENITTENVVELLRHAVTYKLDSLMSHAVEYIAGEDALLKDNPELEEFARTNLKDFLQLIKDERLVAKVPQLIDIVAKAV